MDLLSLMLHTFRPTMLIRRIGDGRVPQRPQLRQQFFCARGWWVLLALLCTPLSALAHPQLNLTIDGDLSESQRQNVRSFLSLARLPDNETLDEAVFQRLYRITRKEAAKALEPFGYYEPAIELSHQRNPQGIWQVTLNIHTGEPVLVSEVALALQGEGAEDKQLLAALQEFPLGCDAIFDHRLYEKGKEQLITLAMESGYQRAEYRVSRVAVSKKQRTAAIQLQLATGPRYRIGPVRFEADFIDHDLLRKITPIHEGDPYSPRALTLVRQSLFNAGYFASVDVHAELDQAEPASNKVPITIQLTPNLAHKYGIGLGYGTDTGARATLEYTNRHINRFGHQLDVQSQPAQRKSNFGGVYTIPIGDPKRDRLSLTGRYQTEEYDNTLTDTLNTTISHDHFRNWGEFSTYFRFLDEDYDTGSLDDSDHTRFLIPGIKGALVWADDRIATTRGLRITATLLGSTESLLADADFLQTILQAKGIYAFGEQWRLIGRSEIGTTLVDDIYAIPPSLRFYAGGDQSVRGYGYKKIAPRDDEGNLLGGRNLLTYSLEVERSLYEQWSGAVFYDSGMVSDTLAGSTMHSGAGVGLRWNGIFGQIRLDLAKALDENGSWRIHFTMGADL